MNTEDAIEELPNARIEEYGGGLGIRPKVRGKFSRKYLGPFGEIQVQPDGTILGIYPYGDQPKIEQLVLPNGACSDRYHEITFIGDSKGMVSRWKRPISRWGAFAYLLSEEDGKPLNRRNYHEITPTADGFYYATFGGSRYILDEDGHVVASKKVVMPWKKRRKDIDLNHLLGPLKTRISSKKSNL